MSGTAPPIDTYASASGNQAISTPMVAALEAAWATIRQSHPEIPPAVIVLGAGSIGARGELRLGHFAAMRWHGDHAEVEQLAEVFVGGEGLRRGAADVLATLLHEAAHALAHARGIKDTSRQGRYHNAKFKELAEELRIEVSRDPRIGWSVTSLPANTRESYADTVAALAEALRLYRAAEQPGGGKGKTTPPPCVCECGRRIRVAPGVLADGPITCGVCGTDFQPDEK